MVQAETWYREASLEGEYLQALRRFVLSRSLVDLEHLERLSQRGGFERRLLRDLEERLSTRGLSEGILKKIWELSEKQEELSTLISINVWNPRLSDNTPGGVDLDVTIPGITHGEVTLYRGGGENEWGSWGESLDFWMGAPLLTLVRSIESDYFKWEIIHGIIYRGDRAIDESGIEVGDALMQEVNPEEGPIWGDEED